MTDDAVPRPLRIGHVVGGLRIPLPPKPEELGPKRAELFCTRHGQWVPTAQVRGMGREHWVVMGRFPHSLEQESDDVWVTCDACLPEDVADRILNLEDLRLKVYAGENKIDLDAVSRPAFPAQ